MGSLLGMIDGAQQMLPERDAHYVWVDAGRLRISPNPPAHGVWVGCFVSEFGIWWFHPGSAACPPELRINGLPVRGDVELTGDRVEVRLGGTAQPVWTGSQTGGDSGASAGQPPPHSDKPSPSAARLLLGPERFRGEWRLHWIFLVKRISLIVLYVVLATLAVRNWINPRYVGWFELVVIAGGLAVALQRCLHWYNSRLVLTSERLILVRGMTSQRISMIKIQHLTGLQYTQTPLGRRLRYGSFRIESAGYRSALHRISELPNPGQLYRYLTEEINEVDSAVGISGAVSEAVERSLGPPRIPDIEGRISARWERAADGAWQVAVTVQTGRDRRVESSPDSRPFRLTGGDQRERTSVQIALDLPGYVVDLGNEEVLISTDGGAHVWTGRLDPPAREPVEAWVTLFTYGRFLQSIPVATDSQWALPHEMGSVD